MEDLKDWVFLGFVSVSVLVLIICIKKYKIDTLVVWLSSFAFLGSILTFAFNYTSFITYKLETGSFLVSVLAVLVTVLLAWNIFNVVSFDDRIEKIKKDLRGNINRKFKQTKKEIEETKQKTITELNNSISESLQISMITYYDELLVLAIEIDNNFLKLKSAINLKLALTLSEENSFISDEHYELTKKNIDEVLDDYKNLKLDTKYVEMLYRQFVFFEEMYPVIKEIKILEEIKEYLLEILKK